MFYILNTFLTGDSVILLIILHWQFKLNQLQVDGSLPSLQPFLLILIPFFGEWCHEARIVEVTSDEGEQTQFYHLPGSQNQGFLLFVHSLSTIIFTNWEKSSQHFLPGLLHTNNPLPPIYHTHVFLHPSQLPSFLLTKPPLWEYNHTAPLLKITPLWSFPPYEK